jgi:16S rRNA (cytidine1402-2'-O)-methyltransferase
VSTHDRPGRLVVCATPIGNLADITLRVLDALREATVIACEDTRHTRVLLDRYGIAAVELISYHEHNERRRSEELLQRMRSGDTVALVSDAGTPLLCDPGYELVRACVAAGIEMEVLPGASAALTALLASGLPVDRFRFAGFLPRARTQLQRLLAQTDQTLIAFESPRRLASTLALLAEHDPQRPLAVCRELTKMHEEVRRGSARQLAEHYTAQPARGEVVLVIGAAEPQAAQLGEALDALQALVAAGARARPAASAVAKLTGLSANELYRQLTG